MFYFPTFSSVQLQMSPFYVDYVDNSVNNYNFGAYFYSKMVDNSGISIFLQLSKHIFHSINFHIYPQKI